MPKISIIIPVYNDGENVERAINSILNQTLHDVEIVCVNDGSTDNSLDVLRDIESEYDCVKVFSQENKGVAHARNLAMEKATGEYIGFLDADDVYIDEDCLERLYDVAHANDAGMATGNIFIWNQDGSFSDFVHLEYYTEEKVLLPEEYGIPFSFTKCIYKREFLEKHNIVFPILTKGEDPAFLAEVLSKLDKFYAVPTDVYAYGFISGVHAAQKYTKYGNYLDQITQYDLVFKHLSDPKFDKYRQEFRGLLFGFIDMMGPNGAHNVLKAIREVFVDDKETLRDCEDYIYFKYENNDDLKDLVKFEKNPEKPRISVVVPAFGDSMENEINLDCILNQSFDDFDINIFTDNENFENICDLNNDKISVHEINENTFFNDVLDKIKGEFVFFFNPKDNVAKKHLKELYKNIIPNSSDLALNGVKETSYVGYPNLFNYRDVLKVNFNKFNFNHSDAKDQVLNSFFTPIVGLYRKSFLEKNFVEFKNIGSNDFFMLFYLLKAKFMSFCIYVNYEYSFDNIKNNFNDFKDLEAKFDLIKEFLMELDYFDEFEDIFLDYKANFSFKHLEVFKSEEFYNDFKEYLLKDSEISLDSLRTTNKNFNKFLDSNSAYEYELRINIDKLNKEKQKLLKDNKKLKKDVKKLKNKKNKIIKSKSWKITKPLRFVKNFRF